MTAGDIITAAQRLIRIKGAPGRGASTYEDTEALAVLNSMVDGWNAESLTVRKIARAVYTLPSSAPSYSIGTGATLNAQRPQTIEHAGIIFDGSIELPLEVLDDDQWAAVRLKLLLSDLPTYLYYDRGTPFGLLYPWPVPPAGSQLVLYTGALLGPIATAATLLEFPPGYQIALEYNLAVELAPRYERAVLTDLVVNKATVYKGRIKAANAPSPIMQCDGLGTGRGNSSFNMLTGDFD